MVSKGFIKKIMAGSLAAAMLMSSVGILPAAANVKVAEAAVMGDEASDGLTAVDRLVVSSPNGKIRVQIWNDADGAYYYSAYLNDYVVIQCSPFGLEANDYDYRSGYDLDESSVKVVDGKYNYDLIQGPVNHVNKEYKELDFTLVQGDTKMTMNFRVDNEGIAYRYQFDADSKSDNEAISITDEDSNFILPDSSTLWTVGRSATYEAGEYTERSMSQVKSANATYSTPILATTGQDANNAWVLLSEASVYNNDNPYCASVFQTPAGKKNIKVRFGEDLNDEQAGEIYHKVTHDRRHTWLKSVDFTGNVETPWRVAIIGETLDDVTKSTLIPDLNPDPVGDFDWVEPGTSVWSWWSTFSDNIDYDSMMDYIDFCSESGITYCLVDFGWENWPNYEEKVKGLVEYANERNVGLLLWYGVHKWDAAHQFDLDNEADIEEQFAWCEQMGIKGVKVDYIESDSQFAMKNMYWIIESAARHHLVVNFHGATDPNGENKTFPNLLSSEAVCGMEYFKWSNASPVETLVTLPYTRNVIGSMEYTPALFAISHDSTAGSHYSPATNGFMLSMCINYESAVATWAQSGYVYPGYRAFPLIADVPSTWDESILIDGYPRKDVVRARRNGENWYVGAMSVPGGMYEVPLTFLDEGEEYVAYVYQDNADATDIECVTKVVTSTDYLDLELMANGGCAVKLTKNDPEKHTLYDDYTFYEAEKAALSGKTSVKEEEIFVSGKAYVQGLGSGEDNSVTFTNVNVPEAGTYDLKIYVVASNKSNLTVCVNNTDEQTFSDVIGIAGDGGAVGAYRNSVTVDLEKGDNTIALYTLSGRAPAIDRIAVGKPLISNAEVKLEKTEYDYTGNRCEPKVTVVRDGKTLTEGTEYSVFYSNSIKSGTASVYVTGINGFGGQIKTDYTIKEAPAVQPSQAPTAAPTTAPAPTAPAAVTQAPGAKPSQAPAVTKPGKVTIKSVKSPKKKTVKVTYNKVKGATAYQIAYSTNKKLKKAKTIKVKTVSATIKKLKSKKIYYVKVRALNGKIIGSWSKIKRVKVK